MVNINVKSGYGAILVVMMVGIFLSSVMVVLSIRNQYRLSAISSTEDKYKSLNLVESCIEEMFLHDKTHGSYPSSVTLPTGECNIDVTNFGFYRTAIIVGSYNTKTTTIKTSTIQIPIFGLMYWQQVE